ncbi:hypothetical protein LguiA_017439 [Lonicera macranthoides]
MDHAVSGINLKQVDGLKDDNDDMDPLMEFMAGLPVEERVVLVGHSMGGVVVSVAMENFSNKLAVGGFVTAFMPGPKLPMTQIGQFTSSLSSGSDAPRDIQYAYDRGTSNPSSFLFGHEYIYIYDY